MDIDEELIEFSNPDELFALIEYLRSKRLNNLDDNVLELRYRHAAGVLANLLPEYMSGHAKGVDSYALLSSMRTVLFENAIRTSQSPSLFPIDAWLYQSVNELTKLT